MIAVDQREVERRCIGQHVEAQVAVEHVAARKPLFVLGGIELGKRVDDVQLGLGAECVEREDRGLAPQGADLDDAPRLPTPA